MARVFLTMAIAALAAGCASSSHVIVGTVRPAISPSAVKLYLTPPSNYDEVALLKASSSESFSPSDQAKTNKVIEQLKAQAASLGANGLLLQGVGEHNTGSLGTGFGSATPSAAIGIGFGLSAGMFQQTGNGMAIYVSPDAATP